MTGEGKYKLLIIEDEPDMAAAIKTMLTKAGYHCQVCYESYKALEIFSAEEPHLVLTDLKLPGLDGLQLLERFKIEQPNLPVIIITGYATIDAAVEAMKKGATDFVAKPFVPEELLIKVQKALQYSRLVEENIYLRKERETGGAYAAIVGKSEALVEILETINKISFSDSRVLITGESGTGKELAARAIHRTSDRRDNAFYAINCAALTESLLESELFGHEKGAYTGAISSKKGIFEMAEGGSLFLDEIGDTGLSFQAKLLRVVQEGEFKRVGGTRNLKTNTRIISSSNRDLKKAIINRSFREDLYYRLSVIHIHMPRLSERPEDIPLLVEYFLAKHSSRMKKQVQGLNQTAMNILRIYPWPGNVRELENVVERAVIMVNAGGTVTEQDLPLDISSYSGYRRGGTLEELEKELIERTLAECHGNKTLAAKKMGIGRRTLYEKASRYGISFHDKLT